MIVLLNILCFGRLMTDDSAHKIDKLLSMLHWPPAKSIIAFGGHMHACWKVTDIENRRFVIKVGDRRVKKGQFVKKEQHVFNSLRTESAVEVPKVLAYAEVTPFGFPVLILEFIPAPNGDQWLYGKDANTTRNFYTKMGQALRNLHDCSAPVSNELLKFQGEKEILEVIDKGMTIFEPFLKHAKREKGFLLDAFKHYPVTRSCLIHRDFRERNLLCEKTDGGLLLTLLDFEWACLGDPFYDLAGSRIPFSEQGDALIAGYTDGRGLTVAEWRKLRFYAVLDLLDVFTRQEELTVDISGLIFFLRKDFKKHLLALKEGS